MDKNNGWISVADYYYVCELDDVDDVVSLLPCPTQLAIVTKEATHKTNNPKCLFFIMFGL